MARKQQMVHISKYVFLDYRPHTAPAQGAALHLKTLKGLVSEDGVGACRRRIRGLASPLRFLAQ